MPYPNHYRRRKSQRGVILLMMLITLALVIIALGVAAPKMAQAIKRDREEEMIHRGAQYARAVKKYYKKFGRYPGTIEQLENTNNLRFLRKRYADPMAKDGKWRPVKFGEVQLGQQGGGAGTIGGGGGGVLPPVVGGALNQGGGATQQQPATGQNPTSNFGPSTSFGPSSSFGQQGTQNAQGQQQQQQQQGSTFGQPGQTFGGGAIMGVASVSEAKGFHEYNQKSQYKQWMFVYDPSQDRGALITGPYNPKAFVGQGQVGTPAGQANQPGSFMNTPNSGGQSNFGGQSTFGNQPTQQPQQQPQPNQTNQ